MNFFEQPIINSPYAYPAQHWELDESGQPTNTILPQRRRSELITPVPKPKKQKKKPGQKEMVFGDADGLSSEDQEYNPTPIINQIRSYVDEWRHLKNPNDWNVTPETARLLQHWRHHNFHSIRPFFCQVEAVERLCNLMSGNFVRGGAPACPSVGRAPRMGYPPFRFSQSPKRGTGCRTPKVRSSPR